MDRPLVAVIPGDDAAPEAMAATMTGLRRLEPPVDWDELPTGAELATTDAAEREAMVQARIDAADTVLFGSTNGTTPGVAYMRWGRRTFANVRPVLDQWINALRPAEVTLVLAQATSLGMGTPATDQAVLQAWVGERYPGIRVNLASAAAAGMRLAGGSFQAGNVAHHTLWNPEIAVDVSELVAGDYGTHQLFDARHLMNAGAGPFAERP